MHKDTKEALARLEAELLAAEPPADMDDAELEDLLADFLEEDDGEFADHPQGYQNYANGYRAYNTDDVDQDLDIYSDEVYEEPVRNGGMNILALVCMIASAAAVLYMVVRFL